MYSFFLDKCSVGSANQYFDRVKNCYNKAIADDDIKFTTQFNPFTKFKKEKVRKINRSLNRRDYGNFLQYTPPENKPKWKHAQIYWLFEFWGAFRAKDVTYLKWGNIIRRDGIFYLDFFISKGKTRIFRKIPIDVKMLLLPQMAVFYPKEVEQIIEIDSINTIKKEKLREEVREEYTAVDVLRWMNEGLSKEEIEERMNIMTPTNFDTYCRTIDRYRNKFLNALLDKLTAEHKDDFIFNHGREKKLSDHWTWDEAERKRFKLAQSNNYNALQAIKKKLGITVKLSAHVSRHTATQFTLEGGASNHAISEYLTHKNLATTERYRQTLGVNTGQLSSSLSGYLKAEKLRELEDRPIKN
jgi:integrase